MTYKILHNPRCRKSRETLQILNSATTSFEIIDYLNHPPSIAELKEIVRKLGIEPYDLLRRGETIFKENFKQLDPESTDWIQIMSENPKLIERPIVIKGEKAIIGRPPEKVNEIL